MLFSSISSPVSHGLAESRQSYKLSHIRSCSTHLKLVQRPSSGRSPYLYRKIRNLISNSSIRRCHSQEKLNQLENDENELVNKFQKISPSKGGEKRLLNALDDIQENQMIDNLDDVVDGYVQETKDEKRFSRCAVGKIQRMMLSEKMEDVMPSAFIKRPTVIRTPSYGKVEETSNVGSKLQLIRESINEEIEEFLNSRQPYIRYPEYINNKEEIAILREVAVQHRLGIETTGKAVYMYRLSHNSTGHIRNISKDVYDDVSINIADFRPGKHYNLERLNSFKGNRCNMLRKLASTPTVKVPINGESCTNGVYMMKTKDEGSSLVMYKPVREEKFKRKGIDIGEGAIREEAAYVVDSMGFSRVPPTTVASMNMNGSGAIQKFMLSKMGSLENFGMPRTLEDASKFVPIQEMQRIAILDARLFNTDRHLGNILLLGDEPPYRLVPIDHGCILPSWYALSEAQFGWLEFPQCKEPFTEESLSFIKNINIDEDVRKLRGLKIREECITTLKICTMLLKMCAASNKTIFWLGNFMQRKGCMEHPSELELLIKKCCELCSIPLIFEENEYGEFESKITEYGILSRRPPPVFYKVMTELFQKIIDTGSLEILGHEC